MFDNNNQAYFSLASKNLLETFSFQTLNPSNSVDKQLPHSWSDLKHSGLLSFTHWKHSRSLILLMFEDKSYSHGMLIILGRAHSLFNLLFLQINSPVYRNQCRSYLF